MKPSRELQAILDVAQTPSGEEFKQAIRDSSIEVKDEYLGYILVQHNQRRFVEEERRRHAERIDAAETARRHRQAIDVSRQANSLSKLAIWIAGGAFVVAILAWLFPRDMQASGHREAGSLSAVPAPILQAQPLPLLKATNVPAKNQTPPAAPKP